MEPTPQTPPTPEHDKLDALGAQGYEYMLDLGCFIDWILMNSDCVVTRKDSEESRPIGEAKLQELVWGFLGVDREKWRQEEREVVEFLRTQARNKSSNNEKNETFKNPGNDPDHPELSDSPGM